jgi:hypothetical protein
MAKNEDAEAKRRVGVTHPTKVDEDSFAPQ